MGQQWRLCNEKGTFKQKHQKKERLAPVGQAWTWWCECCWGFVITFAEDVFCGEATCDHCNNKTKLNLVDPGVSTPKMPPRKVFSDSSGIREVHIEGC